jgi:uncharacterized cupin superfamily protein
MTMSESPQSVLLVERDISLARQTELGVHGWPVWKDAAGDRILTHDAVEKSYFLAGSATLTPEGGDPVTVNPGDLVIVPEGKCRWEVHTTLRRHYRSEALSPACCII